MADRSVKLVIDANITGLQSKLRTAAGAATEFGSKLSKGIEKNAAHIDSLSNKVALLGASLTGVAVLAVKRFADFDQAISAVESTSAEAAGSIDQLRAAALDAGARTVYSATEAAAAIEELSKAGLSAADILGGGLDGALSLASAGTLDLADAAGYTSVALQQFKLGGNQASHVADLLAAGAGKAMGDVSDLGQALKQGGLVAAQTGLSIEETTGALAVFAQAGLLGSDAGTSLKTMLQRLTPQSAEAQATFDRLGVSAYDAQGNFVGLADFAGQLQTKMRDLTPEARNAALSVMFGSDAVRAASVLYSEGAAGVQGWIDAVDDQGYAAEVAATKLDNLKGDLEGLSGAFETALIKMGEGANGPLRGLVQGATDVVNAFSDLPSGVQSATTAIIGGGGLVALGVAGLGKLVVGVSDVKASLKALNVSAKTASIAVAGVGAALGIATVAVTAWASAQADAKARTEEYAATLDEFGNRTDATISKINDALSADRRDWLDRMFGQDATSLIDDAEKYGLAVEDLRGYILGNADAVDKVTSALDQYRNSFSEIKQREATEEANLFKGALNAQADSLTDAEKKAAQKAEADRQAGIASEEAAAKTVESTSALDDYAAALEDGTGSAESYTDALKEVIDAQREAAGIALSLRDAQRNYEAAIDDAAAALKENGATLDITTEKGRANQEALDEIARSGMDVAESMRESGATQGDLQAEIERTRQAYIDFAESAGMGSEEAKALADAVGLIPQEWTIQAHMETAGARDEIDRFIELNNGRRISVYVDARVGEAFRVPGTTVRGFAGGGAISGPGSGTSDSMLIAASNGEHMWTADEVAKAGGHEAMYRMRAAVRAGLARFAAGGAVGAAANERDAARRAYDAAMARARRSRRQSDEDAAEKARDRYEAAQDKLERLRQMRSETILASRRGTLVSGATSSLSGAYGLVDQLRGMAQSGDFSKGQRDFLAKQAAGAESAFKRLYGQADKLEGKLADARDRVSELSSIKASASSSLRGGFSLSSVFGQKDAWGYDKPVTKSSILAGARGYANKLKAFGKKLDAVQKKLGPTSGVILQELVSLGVEDGTVAADAILSMNASESRQLRQSFKDIQRFSDRAGEIVTRGFYDGGLSAAEGVLEGLEKKRDAIAKEIERIAKLNANAIRRALGLDAGGGSSRSSAVRSSTPKAMPSTAGASSSASASATVVKLPEWQLKKIGEYQAAALLANPPKAILALTQREQARLHQAGKTAADKLGAK
ncbi:phage tail tape measure protein [Cellulomonas palmilytica]|uniref:phage tail tape measure protein n=1 Tax=Cellulomonas palmilytica TaxID=2608402 RepID=UPI001F3F9A7F|nr:phage tail tape measure protein [Cellulomonas palmilytica]UJP39324.1 phage tail tape measure protein [Cellulomonas palmilytica]